VGDQAQRHRAGLGPGAQLRGLGGGEADGLERLDDGGDRGAGDELGEEELVVVAVGDVGRRCGLRVWSRTVRMCFRAASIRSVNARSS
jgi:hypothetical protein